MTTDIIKVVATLAISIVFDSCHNVRETVEETAVHADVSYDNQKNRPHDSPFSKNLRQSKNLFNGKTKLSNILKRF